MSTAETPVTAAWRPHDTLGARLVLLRRELGLTQREAAERAGIPFGQWQGMEDDGRQSRGLDVKVQRIALAFNVDRDWLMWGGALKPGTDPDGGPGKIAGIVPDMANGHKLPRILRPARLIGHHAPRELVAA